MRVQWAMFACFAIVMPTILLGATTAPTRPTTIAFPSFGVTVPIPAGFERDTDDDSSVVMFVPRGQAGKVPSQSVMVLARPQGTMSFDDIVQHVAKAEHVKLSDLNAQWGGLKAVEFSRDESKDEANLTTERMLLASKDKIVYELLYSSTPEHRKELTPYDEVKLKTTFIKLGSAGEGIASRMPRMHSANGLRLCIPDPFRPVMGDGAKQSSTWLARDFVAKKFAAKLVVIPLPADAARNSLAAAKKEVLDEIATPLRINPDQLKWEESDGKPAHAVSNRFSTGDRFGRLLIILGRNGAANIYVLTYSGDDDEMKRLDRTIDIIEEGSQTENPK